MKTKIFQIRSILLIVLFSFAACEEDDPNPTPNPELPPVEVVMQNSAFSGIVKDAAGNFIPGVNVTTGTESAMTNSAGLFSFDKIGTVNNRSVLKFTKDGYFTVTRSEIKQSESSIEVVMHPKGNSNISVSTNFSAGTAKTLAVQGMKVTIPASSLIRADGSVYTGNVNADMLYLDPNNENFTTMMPGGDMQAARTDNTSATLISYGMVEVSLADDNGNLLQLKTGSESEITYPIPAGMENNPPATIPLWFFDEERGLWIEEGTATLKGNVYVGHVTHFSWHNLDVPAERVTIKGKVTDCNGDPVPNVKVTVDQTYDKTDANGNYQVYVPANTPVTVTVLSKDYNNYVPEMTVPVSGKPGGATVTENLQLPCLPYITGKVINSCEKLVAAYVWMEYVSNGKQYKTTPVWTNADGSFKFYAPNSTGSAKIWVETIDGDKISKSIQLTGNDVNVTGLEICSNNEEGLITIIPEGRNPVTVPVPEAVPTIILDKDVLAYNSNVTLSFTGYEASVKTYNKGALLVKAGDGSLFSGENIQIEIVEESGSAMKIRVSGNGSYVDAGTYERITASVNGIFDVIVSMKMTFSVNVTDWATLSLPATIPAMYTPIDMVASVESIDEGVYKMLYYKDRNSTDYSNLKSKIADAGYAVGTEEQTEDDITAITYRLNDCLIILMYSDKGIEGADDESYKLVVYIWTNYNTNSKNKRK